MKQPSASTTPLSLASTAAGQPIRGIIRQIDLIRRELSVEVSTGVTTFDVPADCPVLLHGERIKLRLVQPGDRVAITWSGSGDLPTARYLAVQPDL